MNKQAHLINGAILSVGIAVMLEPGLGRGTLTTLIAIGVPLVIGVLFPDVDTAIGYHRRTFHNLPVLALFILFPLVFDNLHYVWLGILTHYILDLLGNVQGIALLYPYPKQFDIPIGVSVNSPFANVVTLTVTGLELYLLHMLLAARRVGLVDPTIEQLLIAIQ